MDAEGLYRAFGCGHSFWMGKQRSGTTGGSLRAAHAVLSLPGAGVFLPWHPQAASIFGGKAE